MKLPLRKLRVIISETWIAMNAQSKTKILLQKLHEPITAVTELFRAYNLEHEAHPSKTVSDPRPEHYSDVDLWQRQVEYASEELKQEIATSVEKVQKKLYNNEYITDIRNTDMPQRKWQ